LLRATLRRKLRASGATAGGCLLLKTGPRSHSKSALKVKLKVRRRTCWRTARIRFIQQLLGHEKLDTTAIYTEVSIKELQEVDARCHPAARLPEPSPQSAQPDIESAPKTAYD
jgi:hypothetical protein